MNSTVSKKVNRVPRNRWNQIPKMLADQDLDVLITVSPENVTYTSGHFEYTLPFIRDRISATVIPANGEPVYLVVNQVEDAAQRNSWIKDVRIYKENAESPIGVLAKIIIDKGFATLNIAIEEEFLTAGFFEELRGYLPKAHFHNGSTVLARARSVKTDEEVAFIEAGVKATETAHLKVFQELKVGDTEVEIARRLCAQTLLEGADLVWLNTVSAGHNTLEGHHVSDATPIQPGDVIQTDTGGVFSGYISDISRQVVVGAPNPRQRSMWTKLRDAQREGVESIQVGIKAGEVYTQLKQQKGWENIWPYGHGLGVFIHDIPMLLPYYESGLKTTTNYGTSWELEPNMLVMVEFALYDREGAQRYTFEDLVLVTEKGPRVLSNVFDTTEMFVVT